MSPSDEHPRGGTVDAPWQVREVSRRIGDWISRLGRVWVEGQVAEITIRPGQGLSFLVLRDTSSEVSLQIAAPRGVVDAVGGPLTEGARVVVHASVEWWERRGEVRLKALEIRPVGLGELLALLEARRRLLAQEGLFDDSRKRPLPFLPRRVGLICGRASAAEHDVVENARRRWPAVEFEVRTVAVQGPEAAGAVRAALIDLDAMAEVDVIVITRGGGSFEDLLPFSDESLVRAVAAAFTPVVSAIGHEEDSPLLDLVADVRASTPTDAARRIVPDVREERAAVRDFRDRLRSRVVMRLTHDTRELASIRSHPSVRDPRSLLVDRQRLVAELRSRLRSRIDVRLRHEGALAAGRRAELRALSPQATLERGFAVVRTLDHTGVITRTDQLTTSERVDVRLATGSFVADVVTVTAAPDSTPPSDPPTTSRKETHGRP
ncbi:MAG: exodeoxyribonuclease VII large subunit [Actinobacteria bacterium]|uniref:Unannotated protein n=1 Tax=freshwater metagenome TaxID=449393 RepID=A0A6J7QZK1_9ZZZZ|nr:exodeoxyribonuclease VII large subunit [Actinomycetota bacterium]MSW42134.1 exodeoxyribonuclease VII large subunit [Actinomycetota bacterium]